MARVFNTGISGVSATFSEGVSATSVSTFNGVGIGGRGVTDTVLLGATPAVTALDTLGEITIVGAGVAATATGTGAIGRYSTLIGSGANSGSTTVGIGNVALGWNAGYSSTGNGNIFIGTQAGTTVTTGANNIIISNNWVNGSTPGLTTGSGNVILGNISAGVSSTSTNTIYLVDGVGSLRLKADSTGVTIPSLTTAGVVTNTSAGLLGTVAKTQSGAVSSLVQTTTTGGITATGNISTSASINASSGSVNAYAINATNSLSLIGSVSGFTAYIMADPYAASSGSGGAGIHYLPYTGGSLLGTGLFDDYSSYGGVNTGFNSSSHPAQYVVAKTSGGFTMLNGVILGASLASTLKVYIGDFHPSEGGRIMRIGNGTTSYSWTTEGRGLEIRSAVMSDVASTPGTTIAHRTMNSFGTPTFSSTNGITVTNASNVYIAGAPTSGASTSITDSYALYVNSGKTYFGGAVTVPLTPVLTTDAASKAYVDSVSGGATYAPLAGATFTGNVTLPVGTTSLAPLKFNTASSLNTTSQAGAVEFDGKAFYGNTSNGRGYIPSEHYVISRSTWTPGAIAASTIAAIFQNPAGTGLRITVQPNTTYFFECSFAMTGMSATTGNAQFYLAGGATISDKQWHVVGADTLITSNSAAGGANGGSYVTAGGIGASSMVTTSTNTALYATVTGFFVIGASTADNTVVPCFIPLNTTSASFSILTGAWFRCRAIGSDSTNAQSQTIVGPWS